MSSSDSPKPQLPKSCEVCLQLVTAIIAANGPFRQQWHNRQEVSSTKPEFFQYPSESLPNGGFLVYNEKFLPILGPSPTIFCVLHNPKQPYFHEAAVYVPCSGDVYVTSNQLKQGEKKFIQISRIFKEAPSDRYKYEFLHPGINLANGAVNYKDGVLFCEQGTLSDCGGLTYMSPQCPDKMEPIITNYHGRWFNSVNDVVIHSDGSIWFTDPQYGYEQHIRPRTQLPNQVYRYDPKTDDIRAVADGLVKPNGLCFSPDEETMYVTDTAGVVGEGDYDPSRASSM